MVLQKLTKICVYVSLSPWSTKMFENENMMFWPKTEGRSLKMTQNKLQDWIYITEIL